MRQGAGVRVPIEDPPFWASKSPISAWNWGHTGSHLSVNFAWKAHGSMPHWMCCCSAGTLHWDVLELMSCPEPLADLYGVVFHFTPGTLHMSRTAFCTIQALHCRFSRRARRVAMRNAKRNVRHRFSRSLAHLQYTWQARRRSSGVPPSGITDTHATHVCAWLGRRLRPRIPMMKGLLMVPPGSP